MSHLDGTNYVKQNGLACHTAKKYCHGKDRFRSGVKIKIHTQNIINK